MSDTLNDPRSTERALALRQEFDRAFAVPMGEQRKSPHNYLACKVGAESLAIPLPELSGLQRRGKVVPLRGSVSGLLGVAGIRSRLIPVYQLGALLGLRGSGRVEPWWAVCGTTEPVGLAFDEFEGYLQASAEDRRPRADAHGPSAQFLRELLVAGGQQRPILHMASLIQSIRHRAGVRDGHLGEQR